MSDSEIVIGLLDSLVDEDYERGRRNKAHSRRRILSSESDSDHRTNSGSRSPEFQTHARYGSRSPQISSRNDKSSSRSPQIGSRTIRTGSVSPVKIHEKKRKASPEKRKGKRLKENTSNDSLFKKISEERSGNKEGPKIHKKLAKVANRAFSEPLEIGKLKDLFERHPRPANTDKIVVPKVNSEIWATLSARAKQRDAKALQVQRTIVHSTFCVLEAVNDVLELENEHIKEKVVKNLTDAVHMLGLTNYDLSLKRRHAMKFELSPDPMVASALCAPEVKVTEFLFGKDVATTTSKAKSVADLKKSFGRPKNVQGGGPTVIADGRTRLPVHSIEKSRTRTVRRGRNSRTFRKGIANRWYRYQCLRCS
ncbi:uncharacterized protein LOC136043572 isoform X1 [Artemia franciscana]|uniref:uncharacterized protein LOC136043572 isoform X1 n=2 Tax=Artemia franciscana TaxID=6661 RepID=UPI0032D9F3D8